MSEYKNKEWLYKLSNGKFGIVAMLVMVIPFTALTLWLYNNQNGAYIFSGFIDFWMIVALIIAIYRGFAFKVLIGRNEMYYRTRPGNGRFFTYPNIQGVWVSSHRGEYYCTVKTYEGEIIKIPFYSSNYDAVEFLKEQVKGRKRFEEREQKELDTYEINGKSNGKAYIIGSIVILINLVILQIFYSKATAYFQYNTGSVFKYIGVFLGILVVVILIVRYKYLNIKIDREGFLYQIGPFKKKYYRYEDVVRCELVTKRVRTGRFENGGSNYYYDFFVFTDRDGNIEKFQYENSLHNYEIYVLQRRINEANGIETEAYIEDEDLIEEEFDNIEKPKSDEYYAVNRKKRRGVGLVVTAITVILLVVFVKGAIGPMNASKNVESQKLMDHEEVKELLVNEGFNTEDMKTSYWYLEENKLMFVAAGEKDKCKIEFYQYNDGETTNGVYNTISYNFNQDLEFKERENYEKELENGGKIFEMDVDGKYNVVAFKDNTVVYGYCQAKDKSIVKEIVEEIGYK